MSKRGPKESEQMKEAREMMKADPAMSAYRAAKNVGLSASAISKSPWYREMVNERQEKAA